MIQPFFQTMGSLCTKYDASQSAQESAQSAKESAPSSQSAQSAETEFDPMMEIWKQQDLQRIQKTVENTTIHGDTPLHFEVLTPEQVLWRYPECNVPPSDEKFDEERAISAAELIQTKADVTAKNSEGFSVVDVAKRNAARFPNVLAVIMAGKTIQEWDK